MPRLLRGGAIGAWVLCAVLAVSVIGFVIRTAWMTVGITPGVDPLYQVHNLVIEAISAAFVLAASVTALSWLVTQLQTQLP